MGLEYITQPQVFLSPITAVNGIQGINEAYPLLTTYQSWVSTAVVDTSAFPIPGNWTMLDEPGSFIVTVGGVFQPSAEYTVNRALRTLTFSTPVCAGVEIAVQQLATAAPSSQNFDFIKSVSANFISVSAITGTFDTLLVTNLTGLSTVVNIIDVQVSEVSGFRSTGDVEVLGNVNVTGLLNTGTQVVTPSATITNINAANAVITNLTATNFKVLNSVDDINIANLISTDVSITSLTATNATVTGLTATNVTVAGNIEAENLSKYFILSADLTTRAVSATTLFFNSNNAINLQANKNYKLNYDLYFLNLVNGSLRYILSASNNLNSINCNYVTTSNTGISGATLAPQMASTFVANTGIAVLPPFAANGTLSHNSLIQAIIQTGDACTFNLVISGNPSTNTITPRRGSSRVVQLME